MNIFNNNDRLQDLAMYSLDWAIFLRHDLDGPVIPFLFLQKDDQLLIRTLVTDGDPMEYAKAVLSKEEKPYDQFVLGFEGYISDSSNGTGKTDALIIHGFDRTQDKGVSLAQAFIPKEKEGGFRRLGKVQFLGNPDLPVAKVIAADPDYSVEALGFSGINYKKGDRNAYAGIFTHKNPSVITDGMKRYLRGKLTGTDSEQCEGSFELTITPDHSNTDFLKYTVISALEAELESDLIKNWEKSNGRKVIIQCKYGDELWLGPEGATASVPAPPEDQAAIAVRYKNLSEKELMNEFQRIVSLPDARTNITSLSEMKALMDAFKERGIPLPVTEESAPSQKTSNSSTFKIFIVLLIIIILYFVVFKK